MTLDKAYHHTLNDTDKWDKLWQTASCISEQESDNDIKSLRNLLTKKKSSSDSKEEEKEKNLPGGAKFKDYKRNSRNIPIYAKPLSKSKLKAMIEANEACPAGGAVFNACGNKENFGGCGLRSHCYKNVCPANWKNDQMSCGCNNGCFINDYYCSCIGVWHPKCFSFHSLMTEYKCHAGTTCITIKSVHGYKMYENSDMAWGKGDPYIELTNYYPRSVSYDDRKYISRKTRHLSDVEGRDFVYNQKICFTMRWSQFTAHLYDYDPGFDDLRYTWPDPIQIMPTGEERSIGGDGEPKLVFETQKIGW